MYYTKRNGGIMPTFRYDKLVRDTIPSLHIEAGHSIVSRKLENKELSDALIAKLHEEADEINNALDTDELLEEIADVQQIIEDLCATHGFSKEDVQHAMAVKALKKGGFLEGAYIETVTMPNENDEWVAYCRKSPEKYPEVH